MIIINLSILKSFSNWGLGIGDWGLGIGPNPQSPIPNPQSPIPNPQFEKNDVLSVVIINYEIIIYIIFY
jgi:hypothetical protein